MQPLVAEALLIVSVGLVMAVVVPSAWIAQPRRGDEGRPGPPPGWGWHSDRKR